MSEADSTAEIDQFLNWAASAETIFERPEIRHLQDGDNSVFRSTVQIKETFLKTGSSIFGTGRGSLASTSLVKAYAEALERFAMISRDNLDSCTKHLLGKNTEPAPRIPSRLVTSNGWAVHFDLNLAVENAFHEALERHILQLSFFKEGWQAFELIHTDTFVTYSQESFISKYSVLGHKAGLVRTKSKTHSGHTYGYFAAKPENFNKKLWLHAKLESVEPLLLFDSMDEVKIRNIFNSSEDFVEKNQLDLLLRDNQSFGIEQSDIQPDLEFPSEENIFITEINLKNTLRLPFDLFAAHVYSPAFLTLTPPILDRESTFWISKTLALYKIGFDNFKDLSRYVPIY